jgi:hypothetical protein
VRRCVVAFVLFFTSLALHAQEEGASGLSLPVTASTTIVSTDAARSDEELVSNVRPAFRAVISPNVILGPHWSIYASEAIESATYYNGTGVNYSESSVNSQLIQAFVAYTNSVKGINWLVKAGRLKSAFGLGPSEYDDARMPLAMPPPIYFYGASASRPASVRSGRSRGSARWGRCGILVPWRQFRRIWDHAGYAVWHSGCGVPSRGTALRLPNPDYE